MRLWRVKTAPSRKKTIEINPHELASRLKTIVKHDNIEVIHLTIQSMLEELNEHLGEK